MVDTNKYCLWDGCKPYTGNGCRSFAAEFYNWGYRLYRDNPFVEEGRGRRGTLSNKVKESDFEIVSIEKKKSEYAPKLFDLTGFKCIATLNLATADETLKIVQTLYEQK
jgi:DNA topoisomerase IA